MWKTAYFFWLYFRTSGAENSVLVVCASLLSTFSDSSRILSQLSTRERFWCSLLASSDFHVCLPPCASLSDTTHCQRPRLLPCMTVVYIDETMLKRAHSRYSVVETGSQKFQIRTSVRHVGISLFPFSIRRWHVVKQETKTTCLSV